MQETWFEASAGGGTVTAKMDGRKQLLSLRIDPEQSSRAMSRCCKIWCWRGERSGAQVDGAMQSTVGGMLAGWECMGLSNWEI